MSPDVPFSMYLRRLDIAMKIVGKKRIAYKALAEEYKVSVRTIKRDVAWIRKQVDLPTIKKIVGDKVVGALDSCDEKKFEDKELVLKYGLPFLGRSIPQKLEAEQKYEEVIKRELTINFNELSKNAKRKLLAAEEILAGAEGEVRT